MKPGPAMPMSGRRRGSIIRTGPLLTLIAPISREPSRFTLIDDADKPGVLPTLANAQAATIIAKKRHERMMYSLGRPHAFPATRGHDHTPRAFCQKCGRAMYATTETQHPRLLAPRWN